MQQLQRSAAGITQARLSLHVFRFINKSIHQSADEYRAAVTPMRGSIDHGFANSLAFVRFATNGHAARVNNNSDGEGGMTVTIELRRKVGLALFRLALLVCALPFANGALAQKCVQAGYLPEEGAVDCQPATMTSDLYRGIVGWQVSIGPSPNRTEIEQAGESWAVSMANGCHVRTVITKDWALASPDGSGGTTWALGNTYFSRIWERSYSTFYHLKKSGTDECDTSREVSFPWGLHREQRAACPAGTTFRPLWMTFEGGDGGAYCANPTPLQCPRTPYPIDLATGAKVLTETHVALDPVTGLSLTWHYNSRRQAFVGIENAAAPTVGRHVSTKLLASYADRVWRHQFDRTLIFDASGTRPAVRIARPEGDAYFAKVGTSWTRSRYARRDALFEVTGDPNAQWLYRDDNDDHEYYSSAGQLVRMVDRGGRRLDLVYASGRLERVRNGFGHFIRFEYDANGLLSAAVNSAGNRTTYAFDATAKVLKSVTFPGGAVRRYLYEGTYKHLLTGITDELGARLVTYAYDSSQRPVSAERAGGVNRYAISYRVYSPSAEMRLTGPMSEVSDVYWRTLSESMYWPPRVIGLAGFAAPVGGMQQWWKQSEHDANGNVSMRKGFDDVVARSVFDTSRNLETRRIDNADTTAAQTSHTQWHPDWNLPTRTATPNQLTTTLYNGQTHNGQAISCAPSTAQLAGKPLPLACWVIEQPTADSNGSQGFNAAPSGNAAVTRATYNANGQVLLHERYDEVTPAAAATPTALPGMRAPTLRRTYTYAAATDTNFTRGDLQTLTLEWPSQSPPPAAQTTTFRKYNKRGQVLEFHSPDGSVSTLTYHARGWLTQFSVLPVGGNLQTTRYEYDAAGQLKKATLPDGAFVSFGYDGAHRLVLVTDSLGGQLTYSFDNANSLLSRTESGSSSALDARLGEALTPMLDPIGYASPQTPLNRAAVQSIAATGGSPATTTASPLSDSLAVDRASVPSGLCRTLCVGAGAAIGGAGGAAVGGLAGGAVGTLAVPGFGTIGVGTSGAVSGGRLGALLGASGGGLLANAVCEQEDADCTFASRWQLREAGIFDEHRFKEEFVGRGRRSLFDICACKDGSIVLRGHGRCGKSGPTIPTDARWK